MSDTPLNPDALEAAYIAVSDESWLSARAAREAASAAVSAYLTVAQPELQANSKPKQNLEFVNILETLEAHQRSFRNGRCSCEEYGPKRSDKEHNAHVAEVLNKHMQEREAAAVREAGQYIQLLHRGGLVDRKGVLADIEIAADRIGRGLHANGRDKETPNGR